MKVRLRLSQRALSVKRHAGPGTIDFHEGCGIHGAAPPRACECCASLCEHLCPGRQVYGLDFHGGLAEYAAVPGRCLFPMPASMSFAEGSLICIGLEEEVCSVDTRSVVTRELDVKGAYAYSRSDFAEALSMLDRKLLPWNRAVTRAGFAQGQAVFDDLASGHSSILKAVFEI